MRDDDDKRSSHLVNRARKHAAQQAQQQAPPQQPSVTRIKRFTGEFSRTFWLSMAWMADSSHVAVGGRNAKGAGVLHIWNGQSGGISGHSMRHFTHDVSGPVVALAWSPDGAQLVSVEENQQSGQHEVRVRTQAERPRALAVPAGLAVSQAAWSPDGTMLALSGTGGGRGVVLLDPASGAVRRVLDGLSGPVAWSPQLRLIAGVDGTSVVLCDPDTGQRVREITGQEHAATALAWARHGQYLAVADGTDTRVWDTDAGKRLWSLPWVTDEGDRGPDGSVTSVDWLDGGHYLLEFRRRGAARRDEWGSAISVNVLWDLKAGKTVFEQFFWENIPQGLKPVAVSGLSPDGRISHAIDDFAPSIWRINKDLPDYLP